MNNGSFRASSQNKKQIKGKQMQQTALCKLILNLIEMQFTECNLWKCTFVALTAQTVTFACTLSQNQPEHLKELLHEHCCQHCVPGQPATSDEGSLTQIPSDKPLQRENFSSSLCLTPTLIHPLQLFCSASTAPIISSLSIRLPLLFYLPQITLVLHYLCLFFFQLIFCADLTTAMQSRRGKLYISHPKA